MKSNNDFLTIAVILRISITRCFLNWHKCGRL